MLGCIRCVGKALHERGARFGVEAQHVDELRHAVVDFARDAPALGGGGKLGGLLRQADIFEGDHQLRTDDVHEVFLAVIKGRRANGFTAQHEVNGCIALPFEGQVHTGDAHAGFLCFSRIWFEGDQFLARLCYGKRNPHTLVRLLCSYDTCIDGGVDLYVVLR